MTLLTMFRKNKKFILMGAASLSIVTTIALIILLVVFLGGNNKNARAAIVTNGYGCSEIGTKILDQGGNAVDAAIAALFCDGVSMPQSMGLGGGFLLTLYNKTTGEVVSLNSREVAPGAATENMFQANPSASQYGGLSVAVPGELVGYWTLYQKYGGGLPWRQLVQPTIDLCKNGVYVTGYLADRFKNNKERLYGDPVLRDIYINPTTNETYQEGEYVKQLRLARTLEIVAEEGGYALHNGSLTEGFVQDIRSNGGLITVEDMNNYRPEWQQSIKTTFAGKETLYSSPLPGSGVVLAFIMNILDGFLDPNHPYSPTNYQRIVESFKFAYGMRTRLGDQDYEAISELVANLTSKSYADGVRQSISDSRTFTDPSHYGAIMALPEDHGTAHLSVLAANGDAVSVTSTINSYFGARFASNSTGIILNNEMDDFSSPNVSNLYDLPPSPANFIVPGKRPLSSMCPTIVLDENKNVILIIGAAGGSKITTTVALTIVKHIWYGTDLITAMDEGRIHHQLYPMRVSVEPELNTHYPEVVEGLRNIGHTVEVLGPSDGFAAATAISTHRNSFLGKYDIRRPGSVSYIHY